MSDIQMPTEDYDDDGHRLRIGSRFGTWVNMIPSTGDTWNLVLPGIDDPCHAQAYIFRTRDDRYGWTAFGPDLDDDEAYCDGSGEEQTFESALEAAEVWLSWKFLCKTPVIFPYPRTIWDDCDGPQDDMAYCAKEALNEMAELKHCSEMFDLSVGDWNASTAFGGDVEGAEKSMGDRLWDVTVLATGVLHWLGMILESPGGGDGPDPREIQDAYDVYCDSRFPEWGDRHRDETFK